MPPGTVGYKEKKIGFFGIQHRPDGRQTRRINRSRWQAPEAIGIIRRALLQIAPVEGSVKTAETVCYEIFRELLREARQYDARQFLILASQEVVDMLVDEESNSLAELEAFIGIPIKFQAETLYSQEHYDVVLM